MFFSRVLTFGLAGAVIAGPLAAQGIPRRATIGGNRVVSSVRMMVANPYPTSAADSALAIRVGTGLRDRMSRVAGTDYNVLADSTMNRALVQFGYHPNSLLSPQLARQLAQSLTGRVVIVSTLAKGQGGAHQLQSRLMGTNDDAGYTRTVTMQPSEDPMALGRRAADALAPALKVHDEAKACIDQRKENPKKAAESAEKALKSVPDHGLASYCLALLAQDRNAPADEVLGHLQNAVKGDPLSLTAWSQMAAIHEKRADTAKVVDAYREILRVAPGNQALREQIFRYFLQIGRPTLAREIADEGIKLDPNNAELYDLKSNACLFLGDFTCAVQSLEQAYQVDSTRADTLFFAKIGVAAEQRLADTMPVPTAQDTATFLRWAQIGARKFPNNLTLLSTLNRAYAVNGQVDSSLAVTQRILQVDSTSVTPALAAVQALITAKRFKDATPFIERVRTRGAPEDKERLALLFLGQVQPLLQTQKLEDFTLAADLARESVALLGPQHPRYAVANLLLGYGALFQAATMDEQTEKSKSCEMARREQALVLEAEKAFTIGRGSNADAANKQLETVGKFKPRAAALVKAYCR